MKGTCGASIMRGVVGLNLFPGKIMQNWWCISFSSAALPGAKRFPRNYRGDSSVFGKAVYVLKPDNNKKSHGRLLPWLSI